MCWSLQTVQSSKQVQIESDTCVLIYLSPSAVLICAWAEKGADALGPDGPIVHSNAFPPETLVDTLGAGDTFNAAVIYTLSNGETLNIYCCHTIIFERVHTQTQTYTGFG